MKMCVDKSFSTSYRTINSYAFPIVISKTLLNKIHHGDCLSLFQQIPDESIDMAFADPPFNLKKQYTDYHDDKTPEEYLDWSNQWLRELVRVVKPTGAIFVHNTPKWLTRYATTLNELAVFRNWIAWDAPTNCFFHGLRPAHYGILCYSKQNSGFCLHKLRTPHLRERSTSRLLKQVVSNKYPVHPFGPVLSNVWTDIPRVTSRNYRNRHPCQLPVQLLERLILLATQEREIILDPFMGTDTTAVAALRLGRKFIGFEQSKEYINLARKNIHTRVYPSKIGSSWVSIHRNEIRAIRAKDWKYIARFYAVPKEIKEINTKKTAPKNSSLLDFALP